MTVLHASCVAVVPGGGRPGRGLLILGPSGAGKSTLALRLVGLGARLVADDRTELGRRGDRVIASCPAAIRGLIEARGLGLLRLPALAEAEVALAVDLGQQETRRLPPPRHRRVLGLDVPLLHAVETSCFPEALMLYLQHGKGSMDEPAA